MNSHLTGQDPTLAADDPDAGAPACILSFNVSDPTGASGIAADIATIAAMGAHALPVVTGILVRDTAEVFECHEIDPEAVTDQARAVLEDATITSWKVGFLGSAEGVAAVAEVLSDYTDVPLVSYLPNLSWMDDDAQMAYLDAFRELILPATTVLVGSHSTLTDFLLPEWEAERQPSARELAVAAAEHGSDYVLVTGMLLPDQFIDNVLASPQGPLCGERFERFDVSFVGAGDTLAASVAAIMANGSTLDVAAAEALSFLDQALDSGFRPGMGGVVPDRFFWALPPGEEATETPSPDTNIDLSDEPAPSLHSRNVH